uniref:Neurensin 2 n=1 Tax=Pseudonaja textilis TaxID=8673 RepID=A0A670ZGC2_PSETE
SQCAHAQSCQTKGTAEEQGPTWKTLPKLSLILPSRFKVTLSVGILLLLIGLAALTTGSVLPSKLEDIGEAEFVVLDQRAVEYNGALGLSRAVGVVLCAVAGVLLVASVLLSRLGRRNRTGGSGEDGKEEQLSPILPENGPHPWGAVVSAPPAPFQVSRVQGVQPKREV